MLYKKLEKLGGILHAMVERIADNLDNVTEATEGVQNMPPPKDAPLAWELFWAEGNPETADPRKISALLLSA